MAKYKTVSFLPEEYDLIEKRAKQAKERKKLRSKYGLRAYLLDASDKVEGKA